MKKFSSFVYLNVAQFLGAINDNLSKFVIIFFLNSLLLHGKGDIKGIVALAGAIYVVPFLLLSALAGNLADRISKRNLIIGLKAIELTIALLLTVVFITKSEIGAYLTLFAMSSQMAFMIPCKYGILPELVQEEEVAKANGYLVAFTYIAVIVGTFLASLLTEFFQQKFVFIGLSCVLIALLGLIASCFITKTERLEAGKQEIKLFFFKEILHNLKIAVHGPQFLLLAVTGVAFFLFVGSFIQLSAIPLGMEEMDLKDVHGSYLFLCATLGIGVGSIFAGKISKKKLELRLIPIGILGVSLSFFLMGLFPHNLLWVIAIFILLGIFGGFYLVPMEALIQLRSPSEHRGKMIGTANFLGFIGVLLSAGFVHLLKRMHWHAIMGFKIMGYVSLIIAIIMLVAMFQKLLKKYSTEISSFNSKDKHP